MYTHTHEYTHVRTPTDTNAHKHTQTHTHKRKHTINKDTCTHAYPCSSLCSAARFLFRAAISLKLSSHTNACTYTHHVTHTHADKPLQYDGTFAAKRAWRRASSCARRSASSCPSYTRTHTHRHAQTHSHKCTLTQTIAAATKTDTP